MVYHAYIIPEFFIEYIIIYLVFHINQNLIKISLNMYIPIQTYEVQSKLND